jgi:hypothetical protein
MPLIPSNPSPHTIKQLKNRAAFAAEWGLETGGGADQSAKLVEILDKVCSPKSGGRDLGNCILPPGIVELQTNCVIDNLVGQRLIGACNTDAPNGPRDWGMSWTSVAGTALYWGGTVGGAVLTIQDVRNFFLEYLDIYLAENSTSNHAGIGIHWRNVSGPGPGENGCFHVAIVSPAHGNIGMKFGDGPATANVDTFKSHFQHFKNLATGVLVVHDQGLVWRFFGPSFHNVDTFFHFEHGGNFFLQSFHSADSGGTGREVLTICKVTTGGANPGQYRIDGGYIDRQGVGQHVVIFDLYQAQNTCIASVSGVALRQLTAPVQQPPYNAFDGEKPASFEVGNRNLVHANGCNLQGQPLVRFRTAVSPDRLSRVVIQNTLIPSGVALGGEAVTCLEGGYAGQVRLDDCQRGHENFSATIGMLGTAGNSNTHRDETSDSNENIINGFDAWPSQTSTDFYNPDPAGDGSLPPKGSWLGITYENPPNAFVAGYWRCDDPLGATSLKQIYGSGVDLPVNSGVQLEGIAPLPYLERVADWSQTGGMVADTGVMLNPSAEDFTIFGFMKLKVFGSVQVMFTIQQTPSLQLGRLDATGYMRHQTSTGSGFGVRGMIRDTWTHFIFTWDSPASVMRSYFSGVRQNNTYFPTFNTIGGGKVLFGGDAIGGSLAFEGQFSRVGVLKKHVLSDKEATLLYLRSTTSITREFYRA